LKHLGHDYAPGLTSVSFFSIARLEIFIVLQIIELSFQLDAQLLNVTIIQLCCHLDSIAASSLYKMTAAGKLDKCCSSQ